MPFPRIVPSALWLVLHLTAGPCRRGAVSASRATRGTTEVCDKGTMRASPCCAIPGGTNVTLSCQLAAPQGRCWTGIFFNSSEQIRAQGDSVSNTFLVTALGRHSFTCKLICGDRTRLICGIDIQCGNPPDEPRNVSCIQKGTRGHPTCTWHKGRLTYLHTAYGIELSNGTHAFSFPEETPSQVFGSGALSKLDFDSNYTVVVSASNQLGNASSQPLTFMLIDIVKPHPPDFWVEFDDSSATSCSIVWPHEAQARHCRLRYRPLGRHSWSTVESFSREKYHLQGLEPDTAHEFQVSCRLLPGRGLWSDWSSSQGSTPAAVPTGTLDVWYRQQELDSGHQNLSLFWKALSRSEAGGRILGYTVTLESLEQGKLPAQSHRTTQTSFSRVTPRAGHRVTVTAHSPRGSSAPAAVLTHLGSPDLPPPQRVCAVGLGNSSILVSWSPPAGATLPVGGYLVEWAEPWREPRLQPRHSWVKLPPSHLSTVIAEHIRDNICYQIHVSALYQDRAGQAASVRGNSTAQAPSAGPQMFTTPWASGVLVSWEEIPAPQQRGCITGYHIYLHRKDGQGQPEVHAVPAGKAPRSLHLPHLEPGEHHELWMTAATAAGEGPRGNSDSVCLESAGGWVTLALVCSFFILSACLCSVPPARRVFQGLLSLLLPQWQSKAIPDPANATWAKSLAAAKAELSAPSSPFLPGAFEEPETSPVEESPAHPEPPKAGDKPVVGSAGSRGHGDWAAESSAEEQQLPELYQRLVVEAMEPPEPVAEYISNPGTLAPEPAPEPEPSPLSVFPTAFLPPALCCQGNLTLDRVKLSGSSFPR
ncbi:interleukin-12 receptor subunit beta-2 [Haemorhous mexicanus]|uniref:interleukin-12 receptor subunit beta-2 n=1 Tax=Haemorhous mexicanus TaxID=30427 RepID=UPI0028BEF57F|nr:interleukin-12 receptor subunit beta-2 [Haemorhous mexicanus]XP_059709529.1 interleukin-12 receptor subunit beta-2 [Haemorhous mexicanus]XP_059709530.1 interleukin-12 receptor subunit beta-2 [Haemorhous mexicanus]